MIYMSGENYELTVCFQLGATQEKYLTDMPLKYTDFLASFNDEDKEEQVFNDLMLVY